MAEPYSRFSSSVAGNEASFRGGIENISNMSGGLQDIAARTGADQITSEGIPSIGGLANMKANVGTQSNLRQSNVTRQVKGLPAYASGYRQYLMWRYPNRYGSGSSSAYTTDFGIGTPSIPTLGSPSKPGSFVK